jgi:predicted nucleic acid-binding protein
MSKIFFDANILLDILLPSRPNHTKAMSAYGVICQEYKSLATSENILTTIEYIASKNKTSCETLSRFFDGLKENFELYGFANILESSLIIYKKACLDKKKIDFEDLLQIQCAIKNRCDVFITEDKGIHKSDYGIKVIGLDDVLS